jgi:hypothetical protein
MWWIFAFGALLYTVYSLRRAKEVGGMPFLHKECLAASPVPLPARGISYLLLGVSFLFLIVAFLYALIGEGPLRGCFQKNLQPSFPVASSRLISFVIDRSGSMSEKMPGNEAYTKMQLVQKDLKKCVEDLDANGGTSDFVSLMGFSRVAQVQVPFTRDRSLLFSTISGLTPEVKPSLNGTALGYAIFKNVRLILACKAFAAQTGQKDIFEHRSMILITDGIEEPNPADRDNPFRFMRESQALENAAQAKVAVYYINVDRNSYKLLREDERAALSSAVMRTGGKYFEVTPGASLSQILQQIIATESHVVHIPQEKSMQLGYWLVILAMLATSLSRLLETAVMRVTR